MIDSAGRRDWLGAWAQPGRAARRRSTKKLKNFRRDGRVVEGARLESVCTARYRGFESLSLRHLVCVIGDFDAGKVMAPQNPVCSRGFGRGPWRTRTRDCGFRSWPPPPVFFSVAKSVDYEITRMGGGLRLATFYAAPSPEVGAASSTATSQQIKLESGCSKGIFIDHGTVSPGNREATK